MEKYKSVLNSKERPKIGVVFSSGGIRPFGGIELLKFLDEAEIPIDLIVGCSGGSIIGSLKGMGFSIPQIQEKLDYFVQRNPDVFRKLNYHTIAGILRVPFVKYMPENALVKPETFQSIINEIAGDTRLENMQIPTVVQLTDAETGLGFVCSQGPLNKIVYGSCAMLPFFPPIEIDGHKYVDGGFSSSLPVLEAVFRDMDIIIAMNFNSRSYAQQAESAFDYFDQLITESNVSTIRLQNSLAVNLHHYEIIFIEVEYPLKISMWEPNMIDTVYKQAKIAVDSAKDRIIDSIESFPSFKAKAPQPGYFTLMKQYVGRLFKKIN